MYSTSMLVVAAMLVANFCGGVGAASSNGWNDNINWVTVDEAATEAEQTGKPIMTVIHKSWCGACKALKPKFAASAEIEALSSFFVMVNAQDDDEPKGDEYKPDGGYIPRILFSDSSNKVHPELHEGPNPKYNYFYSDAAQVAKAMESALSTLGMKREL